VINPAVLWIICQRSGFALCVRRRQLAVIATREDTLAIRGRGEDRAIMYGDAARFAFGLGEYHRLLAKHEHRGAPEEMRGDDRAIRRYRLSALNDGNCLAAGVGHESINVPARRIEQSSRDAAFKTRPNCLLREVAANEHGAAETLLILLPRSLVIAIKDHMHALEDEPLVVILE
jgi:hypothetical protein